MAKGTTEATRKEHAEYGWNSEQQYDTQIDSQSRADYFVHHTEAQKNKDQAEIEKHPPDAVASGHLPNRIHPAQ